MICNKCSPSWAELGWTLVHLGQGSMLNCRHGRLMATVGSDTCASCRQKRKTEGLSWATCSSSLFLCFIIIIIIQRTVIQNVIPLGYQRDHTSWTQPMIGFTSPLILFDLLISNTANPLSPLVSKCKSWGQQKNTQRYSAVIRGFDCYQEQHHLQIKRHICQQFQLVKREIEISSTFVVRCFLHERKNHCFDDLLLLGQQQFGLDNILQSCFMWKSYSLHKCNSAELINVGGYK